MKSEWREYKLGDIASMKYGKLLPNKGDSGQYPVYSGYRIVGWTNTYNCKKDTPIVVARGVGGTGDVKILKKECFLTNLAISVDIDRSVCHPYYFYYKHLLNNLKWLDTGSAQSQITIDDLRRLSIKLPPLPVQYKIVSILSALDDKIETNNAICRNLEEQMVNLYSRLFIQNYDSEWTQGSVSDLGQVVGGGTPSKKETSFYTHQGISWITPKDLSRNSAKFIGRGEIDITPEGLKSSSATIMPAGTVLFSSRAPIGYIAIASNEVTTNQGFKSVIPYERIGKAYVYYFLKNNTSLIENLASGSTFPEISASAMKQLPAMIPDAMTLKKFNIFCESRLEMQRVAEQERSQLVKLRDVLLPKLINGQFRYRKD